MSDITITKINEVWMKVICREIYMEMDIQDRFSFRIKNYKFDPLVKAGKWDGYKKLYNKKTKRMQCGLLLELLEFCESSEYSVTVDPDLLPEDDQLEHEDLKELFKFINPHDGGKPIEPYDYQEDVVQYMMNMGRTTSLSATSSGKALMIFLACRIYQLMEEMRDKRIYIVVPSVSLVEQLYSDFENFSTYPDSQWSVNRHVQKISGKYSKHIHKQIIITTWQSMEKLPHWIYEDMGVVIVDEVHSAAAKTLHNLLEKCINTPYRHGLTGTLDGWDANEMAITGLLGPIKRFVSARDIIDSGRASDIEIHMSMINYPDGVKNRLENEKSKVQHKQRYTTEVDFINALDYRRDFLFSMFESMPGNSLVLFDRVEGYGRELYEEYKQTHPNTFLIIGEIESEEREQIRNAMESHDDATIFASYQTMQQGVSIKKLHNMFLVSSTKSVIRVIQSIGRMMRKHETKDKALVFDIVDNLTINGKENYMMNHAMERVKFYDTESHKIEFDEYDILPFMNKKENIDQFM